MAIVIEKVSYVLLHPACFVYHPNMYKCVEIDVDFDR